MSALDPKETVYIDVDEEITGIVNKVANSKKDIVALVLPKRAAMLQSIVNMKLLKRSADTNDKQVVLITSEARLLPLAGAAKLYVAPNLTSKPYIPPAPESDLGNKPEEDVTVDPNTPVSNVAPEAKFADDAEALEIDNTKSPEAATKPSKQKSGKSKIPNFNTFRKKLIIAGLALVLLIVGIWWALAVAPKAKVVLKTESSESAVQLDFVADPNATEFDKEGRIVTAQSKEVEKTDSETVDATGEKNVGKKATGKITLRNCKVLSKAVTIPAGTGMSADGFTFITDKAVTVPQSEFSGPDCTSDFANVNVTAQEPGEDYNLSGRSYAVSGNSNIIANGSDMKGGTNKIVKIVSDADIKSAKERLASKQNTVQDEIKNAFSSEGFIGVDETFKASPAEFKPDPKVGSEADKVTVSVTTKYTMLGINKDDLKKLIEDDVKDEQTGDKQAILDDGIDEGKFIVSSAIGQLEEGQVRLNYQGKAVIGPHIDKSALLAELAGKRKGPAEDMLRGRPGIIDPLVELSPFWVSSIPDKESKVTFEIQQADGKAIDQ